MKRFLSVLMIFVLTLGLLTACGGAGDSSLNQVAGGSVNVGGNTSSGDTNTPSGDTNTPAGDTNTPAGDTNTPSGDTNTPAGDTNTPSGDTNTPSGDGASSGEVDYEGEGWIKVCSYNVKYLCMNRTQLIKNIKNIDADIVGLQELGYMNPTKGGDDHLTILKEATGYKYAYFTNCTGDYGHGILSRFPIKSAEDFSYTKQFTEHRKYTRFVLDVNGTNLVYYNTHCQVQPKLDNGEWDWSVPETHFKEITQVLYKEKGPALLTADFNLTPDRQRGIVDTNKLLPLNGMKDWTFTVKDLGVDNIYIKNIADHYFNEKTQCGLEMGAYDDASDHAPIWTWIKIK